MARRKKPFLPGRMMLIGGGPMARSVEHPFLQRIIDECGGTTARISILTAGSEEPHWANVDYWEILRRMGVTRLFSPYIGTREDALDEEMADVLSSSDAIYIAGGSQYRFMQRLRDTPVERAMRNVLENGGLLAGTSSGSSVMGGPMIITGGALNPHLRDGMIETGEGFAFLGERVAVDTHASSRGRFPRNLALLAQQPGVLAICIDEDTGLFVQPDGVMQVLGKNAVYFFDGAKAHAEGLHLRNLTLHCLTAGDRFNLRTRKVVDQGRTKISDA